MDFNLLIGSLQLALAAFQFKLDYFRSPANRQTEEQLNSFYDLGEAVRILEYALTETVSFIGQTNERRSNPRLASLWEDASRSIRKIKDGADLADLTFEKNLYWRNPDFYHNQGQNKIFRISLENVLTQLRILRGVYEKHQKSLGAL